MILKWGRSHHEGQNESLRFSYLQNARLLRYQTKTLCKIRPVLHSSAMLVPQQSSVPCCCGPPWDNSFQILWLLVRKLCCARVLQTLWPWGKKKVCEETDYKILLYYWNMPEIGELEYMRFHCRAQEGVAHLLLWTLLWLMSGKALLSAFSRPCLMLYVQSAALPWQAGNEWWPGWQLSHWSPATPERQRHLPRKSQISGWVPTTLHSHTANEKRYFRGSLCTGSLLWSFLKWKYR